MSEEIRVIRRRKEEQKFISDRVTESYAIEGLKRWVTSIKIGDVVRMSGACELVVTRVNANACEVVFILPDDVTIKKLGKL